jgi:hypothetical protein
MVSRATNKELRQQGYLERAKAADEQAAKSGDIQVRATWQRMADEYRKLALLT